MLSSKREPHTHEPSLHLTACWHTLTIIRVRSSALCQTPELFVRSHVELDLDEPGTPIRHPLYRCPFAACLLQEFAELRATCILEVVWIAQSKSLGELRCAALVALTAELEDDLK